LAYGENFIYIHKKNNVIKHINVVLNKKINNSYRYNKIKLKQLKQDGNVILSKLHIKFNYKLKSKKNIKYFFITQKQDIDTKRIHMDYKSITPHIFVWKNPTWRHILKNLIKKKFNKARFMHKKNIYFNILSNQYYRTANRINLYSPTKLQLIYQAYSKK